MNRWLMLVLVSLALIGCAEPADPGPSYAELVVTYNAEMETLERLEGKREKLVADIAALTQIEKVKAATNFDELLESAKGLRESVKGELPTDPNALLDKLSNDNGEAQEIAGQLLDGLLGGGEAPAEQAEPTQEEIDARAARQTKLEMELTQLDEEIVKQKERVARARAARDAAESK